MCRCPIVISLSLSISYYDNFGRTYLFNIDFHHIKHLIKNPAERFCIDAYHAGNVSERSTCFPDP